MLLCQESVISMPFVSVLSNIRLVFRLGFIKMYYICPLAELHTAIALNATTNGRNHLKIEIFNFMSLSFPLHSTMLSGIRKFCDYLFAFQFLLKSIIDMLTDSL